ncbi:DUF1761 domain-containing protein [Arthrobacter pigmenti]
MNFLAVLAAAVAAFIASGAYYSLAGGQLSKLSDAYAEPGRMSLWEVIAELLRSLVTAAIVAGLVEWTGGDSIGAAILLGFLLWIGFPLVLLAGSVLHEKVPAKLAAIHAGDWLIKLVLIGFLIGVWP